MIPLPRELPRSASGRRSNQTGDAGAANVPTHTLKLSQALTVAPRHPTGEAGATNLPTWLPNWPTALARKGWAIARSAHRSGVPSGLSRFASQAKPLLTIAEPSIVAAILFACLAIPAIFAGA